LVGEARYWLREGTNTPIGAKSNALWCTWGNLEWKQVGDTTAAAYCFDMALRVYPRSRYALLSLGLMEKANGNVKRAKELLRRGAKLNPTDAALRQVSPPL
jgi:tetratricopeptide (TPR) repeat protein